MAFRFLKKEGEGEEREKEEKAHFCVISSWSL